MAGGVLVHSELDELDPFDTRRRRQRRHALDIDTRRLPQAVEHEKQRALPVDSNAPRRARTEPIAEDLEREEPVEPGRLQRFHEVLDREITLAGEAAVVAAP